MATQLGYNATDPNNPNNQPYDFGNLSGGMPDISSQLSTTLGSLSQPTGGFTPNTLDTTTETLNAPGPGSLPSFTDIPSGPSPAQAHEEAMRRSAEIQDEIAAARKKSKNNPLGPGLKKGTEKVKGKGDGTKDTVPAILAPGEAVLNKAAAEHLGRGFIKMLNTHGQMKMGMVEPDEEGHFKCGTEEVTKRKKY